MVLESGTHKVKEICEIIRNETLEPAKAEAEKIIAEANSEAEAIIARAHEKAAKITQSLKKDLEKMQNVANSSIELAVKQGLARLKQLIQAIFSEEMDRLMTDELRKEDVIAKIINTLVQTIEKEGIDSKLSLALAKGISKEAIVSRLIESVRRKIERGPIAVGEFSGGVVIKLVDKKFSVEMTDEAALELLSADLSDGLRKHLFRG